jgi:DNA-binding CsgD family transcriptional regulator
MTRDQMEMNTCDDSTATFSDCPPCQFKEPLGSSVLNSLSAHIAILDRFGTIVETNHAWENFARYQGATGSVSIGTNYLSICDNARGEGALDAQAAADGIRRVIQGEQAEFVYSYPCHGPSGKGWFNMRAIAMENSNRSWVIISHEDITTLKLTEEALTKNKELLENQKRELEETNIALRVLLKQREKDKLELEENVLRNLRYLVLPYMDKLKTAPLRTKDKALLQLIDARLKDLISPLLRHLSSANALLTPQEIQIAAMIKEGKSSKQIADILNVAETTVHFHRKNLRRKLGLKHKASNLRAYLMNLA